MNDRERGRPPAPYRLAALTLGLVALAAACTQSGPVGTSGAPGGQPAGSSTPAPGGSTPGGATSAPNPCNLLTAADVMKELTKAGYSATFKDGELISRGATQATCYYREPGPAAIGQLGLDVCSLSLCDYDLVRSLASYDDVPGLGDDAFFESTCQGPDLLGHDHLWAKAKGLQFRVEVGCHAASSLTLAAGDQAMIELLRLAISHV